MIQYLEMYIFGVIFLDHIWDISVLTTVQFYLQKEQLPVLGFNIKVKTNYGIQSCYICRLEVNIFKN